jgi:predicted dinucleotide-binding enzyme
MRHSSITRRDVLHLALAAGGWALGVVPVVAQPATVPPTKRPMKIGIIGAGQQGGSIGLLWARAGHEVFFSSRNPDELTDLVAEAGPQAKKGLPRDAASFGDVILIAVPYGALPQVGKDYGPLMRGKVVIDCGNPREDRDGAMANDAATKGTGVASAEYLPGVRLVRAFNALSFQQVRSEAFRAGEKLGIPIAADDAQATQITVQLVEDAGFDPVVVGPLSRAREFDRGTPVYVKGLTARQLREALKLPAK